MIVNENLRVQHEIQIKHGIIKHQCKCKNYFTCKKDYSSNSSTCICENSKYLNNVVDTSVTEYHEIIIAIATNGSINSHRNKVRDCYILHTVLLAIILLLVITIIWYHYAKHKSII